MAVINPQKTINKEKVRKGETFRLKICFDTAPCCSCRSVDLILAVDCSGSMGGDPLKQMKEAALTLTETLRKASCMCTEDLSCSCYDDFCSQWRMGLISYNQEATLEADLGTSALALRKALEGLKAWGNTNHLAAFTLADTMFSKSKARRKILVLFTDGLSKGSCTDDLALKMQAKGIEIFCIGLGVREQELQKWASAPQKTHVAAACCIQGLNQAFLSLVGEICGSRALGIKILERLQEGFEIQRILQPPKGSVQRLDKRTVCWTLDTAGDQGPETLCLCLDVCYRGCKQGKMEVNEGITYEDACCNCLVFPNPQIDILPDCPCSEDCCPEPQEICGDPCRDIVMGKPVEAGLCGLGRIVRVSAVIKNVCPNKALGVAVLLSEVDCRGEEHNIGLKVYEIPAQAGDTCRDVTLDCLQFVVPEHCCPGEYPSLCRKRDFRARVMANYLTTDFTCCDSGAEVEIL